MAELIEWPMDQFGPVDISAHIHVASRSAGAAMNGVTQIITPVMSYWRVDITLTRERNGTNIKEFEALVSEMRGMTNVANMPICDPYKYGPGVSPNQWPFDDGTWFDDGTGFSDTSGVEPLLTTAEALAGANELYVSLTDPVRPSLRIGDMFSVVGRLYRVVRRNNAGWVKFEPSLRVTLPVGTFLVVNPPRFYGRFIDDEQGKRVRERLKYGAPITLSFIEAFM